MSHVGPRLCNNDLYTRYVSRLRYVVVVRPNNREPISDIPPHSVHFKTSIPSPCQCPPTSLWRHVILNPIFCHSFTCEENPCPSLDWNASVAVKQYTGDRLSWMDQLYFWSLPNQTRRSPITVVPFLVPSDDISLNSSFKKKQDTQQDK